MILPIIIDLEQLRQLTFRNFTVESQFVQDMIDTMVAHNGAGLAAPQVGRAIRLITLAWGEVIINPTIEWASPQTWVAEEGCLSLPGQSRRIERPFSICLSNGRQFEGMAARIIQHEIDHLKGRLILDHDHVPL